MIEATRSFGRRPPATRVRHLAVAGMCATVLALAVPRVAGAQFSGMTLTGEMGSYGELYGSYGREARRPNSTGRLFFRPTLGVTEHLTVSLDLLLSTEGSSRGTGATSRTLNSARQRINQLGISPTWGWGTLHLGDFTDSYTPLTFSGVRVRGAGANVTPGIVRFAAFGGRAKNSVIGGATNGSYARNIYGGKIGIGREATSFFDLIVVRARDDASSLPPASDTAFIDPRLLDDPTIDPDTLPVGTLINPLSVTPQENLVVAAAGKLTLLDQRIRLTGELSGSAYSRDVRASPIANDAVLSEYPGVMRGLFTPRIGSTFGVAYTTGVDVRFGTFTGSASYKYLPPGYVSLGVGSLLNDQKVWQVKGSKRFGRQISLRLEGSRQNDNLFGQKSFTTTRDRVGGALTLRPASRWAATLRANYVGMHNGISLTDDRRIAYGNWIVGTNHTVGFGRQGLVRSLGVGYVYRTAGDDNPTRQASNLTSHAANVRVVLAPSRTISVTPTIGLVMTKAVNAGWKTRQTYGIAGQLRALNGKWSTTVSVATSQDRSISMIQGRVTSQLRVTPSDALTFSLRASSFQNAPDPLGGDGDFRELTVNLQWVHSLQIGRARGETP